MRDLIANSPAAALALGGFIIGVAFGFLTRATNYCVMGAISDWRIVGDKGRLGAAALAAAVAAIGAQALDLAGVTDLSRAMYLAPRINWAGGVFGGLIFGAGMVYAGGCPSRTLVRAGGGDFKAVVTALTMAVAALVTLSGVFGPLRSGLETATSLDLTSIKVMTQGLPEFFTAAGLPHNAARIAGLALLTAPLLYFAIGPARILNQPMNVVAGLGIGLIVTAGWALTGLASDDMAAHVIAPASLSFVKPVADAIDWLQRSTALGLPGLGAASVFGVVAGSTLASMTTGTMRFTGFTNSADFKRHLFGASAMGVGGILGLGCTIGQGVTGLSTLAVQSILTSAAIVLGAVIALTRMQRNLDENA